jgi:hypothetical protein
VYYSTLFSLVNINVSSVIQENERESTSLLNSVVKEQEASSSRNGNNNRIQILLFAAGTAEPHTLDPQ